MMDQTLRLHLFETISYGTARYTTLNLNLFRSLGMIHIIIVYLSQRNNLCQGSFEALNQVVRLTAAAVSVACLVAYLYVTKDQKGSAVYKACRGRATDTEADGLEARVIADAARVGRAEIEL